MSDGIRQERRKYPRMKVSVPVEIRADGAASPIRGSTLDLSLGGCYIETIYPFPVGTELDLKLQTDTGLPIDAIVVTCDPQVGNGIKFTRMLPEDRKALEAFLRAAEEQQSLTPFAR
jgi:c-di-GMP-binding flagellar brake protein YcgR